MSDMRHGVSVSGGTLKPPPFALEPLPWSLCFHLQPCRLAFASPFASTPQSRRHPHAHTDWSPSVRVKSESRFEGCGLRVGSEGEACGGVAGRHQTPDTRHAPKEQDGGGRRRDSQRHASCMLPCLALWLPSPLPAGVWRSPSCPAMWADGDTCGVVAPPAGLGWAGLG
jgi:hypothetical protein